MLSDEEREALEILKAVGIKCKGICIDDVIINLIEKQQKEIEELQQEKEYLNCIIESDKDNYINKDKIKAKIEELEIEQESNREDLKIAIDNLLFQNIDKIGNRISINMSIRGILQSLLEKE